MEAMPLAETAAATAMEWPLFWQQQAQDAAAPPDIPGLKPCA